MPSQSRVRYFPTPSRPLARTPLAVAVVCVGALSACSSDGGDAGKSAPRTDPVTRPLAELLVTDADGVDGLTVLPESDLEATRTGVEAGMDMFDVRPAECEDMVRRQQGSYAKGSVMASKSGTGGIPAAVIALSPGGTPPLDPASVEKCPRFELVGKGATGGSLSTTTAEKVDAPDVEGATDRTGVRLRSESEISGTTDVVSFTARVRDVAVLVTVGGTDAVTPEKTQLAEKIFRTQVEKIKNS